MFGKGNDPNKNEDETLKIQDRLDEGEVVEMWVRQSRVKPGGAAVLTPNTVFVTEKRVIIRNPTRMGLGENIEEYFYNQITNIRLEKGMFSSALVFAIPGMTELSKGSRLGLSWGRSSEGVIDALPKKDAEKLYNYIREKVADAKKKKEEGRAAPASTVDDPIKILKARYAKGEISKEEFEEMKKDLA